MRNVLAAFVLHAVMAAAQTADPALLAAISRIPIVDNHGHPLRVVPDGGKPDDEYDALTFEDMEPSPVLVRIRPDNPEFIDRKSTRLNSSHIQKSRMPSSA